MLRRALLPALLALLAAAAPVLPAAAGGEPLRIGWIGPLSGPLQKAGEESLLGARVAAEGAAPRRPVEVLALDDGDDPKAAVRQYEEAKEQKCAAVLAMATGVTVEALAARARTGHLPVIFVGSAAPPPSPDPADPVLYVGADAVDQAITMTSFLALHSQVSGLGLYRDCSKPAVVAEDTPRGRELAAAVERNVGRRQQFVRTVFAPPHGAPSKEDLVALRDAKCDRLLLLGEPDLLDRTAAAMKPLGWEVPFFCADGMLSRAAASAHDGTVRKANFLLAVPAKAQWKDEVPQDGVKRGTPAEELKAALARRPGPGGPTYSRTRNGWFATWMILQAIEAPRKPGERWTLLGALRRLAYSEEEERGRPLFDDAGRSALVQWFPWTMGEKGPEPIRPSYLPTRDLGPLMLQKRPQDWDRIEIGKDTQVVWLTFGEKEPRNRSDPPRTIEEDMYALGLGSRGYEGELDPWLLDELMVRTLGKINRLFLKNYDGTFVPGVSFDIHFTFTKPEHLKPSQYWVGVIAGEEKDDPNAPGGVTRGTRVSIFSRWMRKYMPSVRDKALKPKMGADDRRYITGDYAWGTAWEENIRSDSIRALVDGYADPFALTGAHEFGHVCGCQHDRETTRSIMNVVDAVGLRSTQAHWIPLHVKALETSLGRWKGR